ncbi:MAG TPA: GNAT family N-acetyltransferase [Chitinophagaceae bacterium]
MEFKTLEGVSTDALLETFNHAFSDYQVPFKLSKEQLEAKLKSEGIRPDLSPGAFEDGKLVAFIIHGFDVINGRKLAYNGGTGVIPEQRGQRLVGKLYEFINPKLKEEGITTVILEVMTKNEPAYRSYTKTGFHITRELNCYKGTLEKTSDSFTGDIRPLDDYNWELFTSFWDFQPTWQNSARAMEAIKEICVTIGAYDEDKLVGYLIYNPLSKRPQQFAVNKDHRHKGLGRKMFQYIANHYSTELSSVNIDARSEDTNEFFRSLGFTNFVQQYEMEWVIG